MAKKIPRILEIPSAVKKARTLVRKIPKAEAMSKAPQSDPENKDAKLPLAKYPINPPNKTRIP